MSPPMRFLMAPLGTAGDVHPFLAIGKRLQQRGHHVTIITHHHFIPLVQEHGFEAVDLQDEPAYSQTHNNPDLWHPRRGSQLGARFFLRHTMRACYQAFVERFVPGETIIVSNHSGFGGRLAHEHRGVPYVSVYTSPAYTISVVRPHRYGFWSPSAKTPLWFRRAYFWIGERLVVDAILGPEINRFRRELGLTPIRNLLRWLMSPELIIGLFPRWFAEPRPEDWPSHLIETEFPLYDDPRANQLHETVEEFLAKGEPPIVFTPGTGVVQSRSFFEVAIDACMSLDRRGIFLTRASDQIPKPLPPMIRHFTYIPLRAILSRASAIVYHGGIGTLAQGLRAGIPHVVMPMAHDQPDNGHRLERLGVGRVIWPRRFSGPNLAAALESLLTDSRVAQRCRELAARIPADSVGPTVEALEKFAAASR